MRKLLNKSKSKFYTVVGIVVASSVVSANAAGTANTDVVDGIGQVFDDLLATALATVAKLSGVSMLVIGASFALMYGIYTSKKAGNAVTRT